MPTGIRKRGWRWESYDKRSGRHLAWHTSKRRAHIYASYRDRDVPKKKRSRRRRARRSRRKR